MFPQQQHNNNTNINGESLDLLLVRILCNQDKLDKLLSDSEMLLETILSKPLSGTTDLEIIACMNRFEEAQEYVKECGESLNTMLLNVSDRNGLRSKLQVLKMKQSDCLSKLQQNWILLEQITIQNQRQQQTSLISTINTKPQMVAAALPIQATTVLTTTATVQVATPTATDSLFPYADGLHEKLNTLRSNLHSLAGKLAGIGISVDSLINNICLKRKDIDTSEVSQLLVRLLSQLDTEKEKLETELQELKAEYLQLNKQVQKQQVLMQQHLQQQEKQIQQRMVDNVERLRLIKEAERKIKELDSELIFIEKDKALIERRQQKAAKKRKEFVKKIEAYCNNPTISNNHQKLAQITEEIVRELQIMDQEENDIYDAKEMLAALLQNVSQKKKNIEEQIVNNKTPSSTFVSMLFSNGGAKKDNPTTMMDSSAATPLISQSSDNKKSGT